MLHPEARGKPVKRLWFIFIAIFPASFAVLGRNGDFQASAADPARDGDD
jgi:hypothetical protein